MANEFIESDFSEIVLTDGNLLVEVINEKPMTKTESGLFIPSTVMQELKQYYKVLAFGPHVNLDVAVGDFLEVGNPMYMMCQTKYADGRTTAILAQTAVAGYYKKKPEIVLEKV
jgi:co-chaperonin GroES (HSP10)